MIFIKNYAGYFFLDNNPTGAIIKLAVAKIKIK